MAFGGVRGTFSGSGGSVLATSTATGSVAVSVGDLVVLAISQIVNPSTNTAVTDNLGGGWTVLGTVHTSIKMWYKYITSAGTLTTISCTCTASGDDYAIIAGVFEGPFTATPLDKYSGWFADTTTLFTSQLTGVLSQADELIVCGLTLQRGQTDTTATAPLLLVGNVASGTDNAANSVSTALGAYVVSATTSVSVSFAATGTIAVGYNAIASFRRGAVDTATGSITAISTATGTALVDIARAGTATAVTTGTTGTGRSDIARTGSASAIATVSATGLGTTVTYPLGLIARASVSTGSANSRTTPAIDTTGANLIFAHISHPPGISVSISDSYGNTWALDLLYDNKPSSPDVVSRLYKVGSNTPIVGPGHTFTFNGSGSYATIEFSAWRSGTTWTVGSIVVGKGALPHGTSGITTATAGDLVFALVSGNGTLTAPSQGTILHQVDTVSLQNYATGHAYLIQPSSPNINISWSGTGEAGVINYTVHGTWLDANASDGSASAIVAAAGVGSSTTSANDTGVGSASAYATAIGISPSGDNVLWTPGSGSTIATDDISGVHYQWMKPVFGADGVVTDVADTDPLPLQGFAKTITSSVTRPANTTAYGTNTAWSNSTSAPSVLTFTNVGRLVGGAVLLNSAQVKVNQVAQDINAELWLFDSIPTAINDGSNFNVSDAELESLVCRVSFAFGGLDTSMVMVNAIGALINHTSGSNSLYGLIRMLRAYTPVSSSKLTFRLQVTQVD